MRCFGRAGEAVLGSETAKREIGLFRREIRSLALLRNNAIPMPRASAKATKYQSAGRPKTKIRALPAAKRRPISPPPNESLCIVMPG